MSKPKIKIFTTLPVFMSYIVMGFVDIVGVSTGYVKNDFGLLDKTAQLLPTMVFVWFFLLSVPTGILLDKIGKKNMLNIGMGITGLGMLIPFTYYSFPVMFTAFVFLGIGNTIVQVAANPLLHDVVPQEKYSSFMSLSQFIKSICSLLGPIITIFMANYFGNWKLVFLAYAITSFISVIWLYMAPIEEAKLDHEPSTFKSCFSLLKNKFILIMVLGMFLDIGAEVGMNTNIANYLRNLFDLSIEKASLGISIFFTALMVGRFSGAVLLNWIKPKKFFIATTLLCMVGLISMLVAPSLLFGRIAIFVVGLGFANLFPLIFAISVERMPNRVNEISGLMIMAIAGGAVIPPIMGLVSSAFGVLASFWVLVAVMTYLIATSIYSYKTK